MNEENIKLTEWNKQTIGNAVSALGDAFSSGDRVDKCNDFVRNVKKAKRNIDGFLNEIYPAPELNNKEANLARALHTYSRKYMDNIFSCFVWQAIDTGFGTNVWYSFIKGCADNKFNVKYGYARAQEEQDKCGDFQSLAMLSILEQWIEFHDMQESVNEIVKDDGI